MKALSGPLKGAEIPLSSGLKFGRTKGDVVLDDSKVSSLHAYVREEAKQIFTLHDNGSKNGIRFGAERVEKLKLELGVRFHIGISEFEVVGEKMIEPSIEEVSGVDLGQLSEDLAADEVPTAVGQSPSKARLEEEPPKRVPIEGQPPASVVEPPPPQAEAEAEARRWNQVLESELLEIAAHIKDQHQRLLAFEPAIQLTFIGGLQVETKWLLGYGPRKVGASSVDLPILEPQSPDLCFELRPAKAGVTFLTNHPKRVLLNGRETKEQVLKSGDVISVGQARIEVELIK